jgi:[acyl-carrier-protein] S-malonyltransferase
MGRELAEASAEARLIYEEAGDLLGYQVLDLDADQLGMTAYAQPAIITLSLAAWRAFTAGRARAQADDLPLSFAGFSLGEYSAIGAAGLLSLPHLFELIRERGRLMQEAAEACPGAMYAVLGLDDEKIISLLENERYQGKVYAANFNSPGQLVISGLAAPTAECAEELRTAGARRIVKLNVNGAFHTPLMASAADGLIQFARSLPFQSRPQVNYDPLAFFANPTGARKDETLDWPDYLAGQMCSPVRWTTEVQAIAQAGATGFYEFGPGKVLSGLIRKIIPGMATWNIEDPTGLDAALQSLRQ